MYKNIVVPVDVFDAGLDPDSSAGLGSGQYRALCPCTSVRCALMMAGCRPDFRFRNRGKEYEYR